MKQLFFGSLLLLLFTACSPKIGTMVTKTYPPLEADSPVAVYLYQTDIPSGTESLGKVTVSDSGFSTNCDSVTVINLIKDEARKIGGDAVCITDHIRPSFWGSSCHQMAAIVLKMHEFEQQNQMESISIQEFTEVKNRKMERTLPKFKVGANIGYGWRGAKLPNDLSAYERSFYKKTMSGIIWDGSFHYYFNDVYGIGLQYSSYYGTNSDYAESNETGETGVLSVKNPITFIGPVFAMRTATNDRKWIFNLNFGLGYLGYNIKETFSNDYYKESGATVGFLSNIGGEYKLNEHWGIGVDLTAISGIVNSVNVNENGNRSTYTLEGKDGVGLGQFRLTTGLRYYF